jgi:hypothetical protein
VKDTRRKNIDNIKGATIIVQWSRFRIQLPFALRCTWDFNHIRQEIVPSVQSTTVDAPKVCS